MKRFLLDRLDRAAALLLVRDREAIVGDLMEEAVAQPQPRAGWIAYRIAGIALHQHADGYRDRRDVHAIALLLAVAAALIVAVPPAAAVVLAGAVVFDDPVTRALMHVWRAPEVIGALAAGLWIGRAPMLADHAGAARWHVGVALAFALFVSGHLVAAATLLGAVGFADASRRASAGDSEPLAQR